MRTSTYNIKKLQNVQAKILSIVDKIEDKSLKKREYYSSLFVKYNVIPVRGIFQFNMYIKYFAQTAMFTVTEHPSRLAKIIDYLIIDF